MVNVKFVNRAKGELYNLNPSDNICSIDVSSYAKKPFKLLSPFTHSDKFLIPVPSMEGTFSHSVEGIWQGLKIIDEIIDESLFKRKPHKRKGKVIAHKFGEKILDFYNARIDIYLPSYYFYLDNYAPKEALDFLLREQRGGKKVYLYDVEDNGDIQNPKPYAHAAALATYLNLKLIN
ncbi:DUF6939 family protein [Nanoarchaeota archaeon]